MAGLRKMTPAEYAEKRVKHARRTDLVVSIEAWYDEMIKRHGEDVFQYVLSKTQNEKGDELGIAFSDFADTAETDADGDPTLCPETGADLCAASLSTRDGKGAGLKAIIGAINRTLHPRHGMWATFNADQSGATGPDAGYVIIKPKKGALDA